MDAETYIASLDLLDADEIAAVLENLNIYLYEIRWDVDDN